MRISIHIDRLVLDGLALNAADGARVRAALEAELGRLLGTRAPGLERLGAVPIVAAPSINVEPPRDPTAIGHAVARSVHAGMGRAK
jgi:hypothetical protein